MWATQPPHLAPIAAEHRHGDARRAWSEAFVSYAYAIAVHAIYADMPAKKDDDGKVDWTIPSNRTPGAKNWRGRSERQDWWRARAEAEGVGLEGPWISRVAKKIHPFGWKPCQICGRWMRIAYTYPGPRTLGQLNAHLPSGDELIYGAFLDIYEIADHMESVIGLAATVAAFERVFSRDLAPLGPMTLGDLKDAVEERLVIPESRKLSPGVMSNAPDRLDGFHTYNLCCRAKQDTGRLVDNLKTYGADRRAFEHWSEGDWEAANLLMSRAIEGNCSRCGRWRQMTADHIGPISLGFRHMPFFDAVCQPCNSAKGNRMDLRDVHRLLGLESGGRFEVGESVASWHARPLWDRTKGVIARDEHAWRLSRLLNVNQHQFFRALLRFRAVAPDALVQFLSPKFAKDRVNFIDLNRATLEHNGIKREPRQETYAHSKAARVVRVAFDALDEYGSKEKRNVSAIPEDRLAVEDEQLASAVDRAADDPSIWRARLLDALDPVVTPSIRENVIQDLMSSGYEPRHDYEYVAQALRSYMSKCGELLAQRLDDEDAIKRWAAVIEDADDEDDALEDLGRPNS